MVAYHKNNKNNKNKTIEETRLDTRMKGKVHDICDKSISIQIINDGECFLIVPKSRVPVLAQNLGQDVTVFLTTKYGHFGILFEKSEAV